MFAEDMVQISVLTKAISLFEVVSFNHSELRKDLALKSTVVFKSRKLIWKFQGHVVYKKQSCKLCQKLQAE